MGTVIAKHVTSGAPKMLNVNDDGELLVKANMAVAVDNIDIGAVNLMNAADALIDPATENTLLNAYTSLGTSADAAVAAGAVGTVHAKLRRVTTDLGTIDADTGNIATSAAVMDDWDESDRAKVNLIAGQAGVAANSGAANALTQRVILATDDPAVTALGTIDTDTGNIATNTSAISSATTAIALGLGTSLLPASYSSFNTAVIDCASGATEEVIAAPGEGYALWIYKFVGISNTADATIVLLSAATPLTGTMPVPKNGGWCEPASGNFAMPNYICGENEAFNITTVGGTFDGSCSYAIVAVLPATTLPPTTLAPTTLPDTTPAPTTLPDTTLPDTTLPDTTLPDTTLPDTTLPE